MTTDEKRAIERMKRAIRDAHKLGIRLAGMDGSLLYATASAFLKGKAMAEECERTSGSCYSAVAHACHGAPIDGAGVLDNKCYEDSGGY
jgi:hypothetical protein